MLMTTRAPEKFRQFPVNFALTIALAAGALEALLLARLLARLLAARPDNPAIQLLYRLTEPLVAPLAALNYDQPPFGAAFEFATLVMAILVPAAAYMAWVLLRSATQPGRSPS
jgi:uncharacterized protein YggT (Ycf19 family)